MGVNSLSSEWLLFCGKGSLPAPILQTFFHVWCTFWYRLATEREEAKLQKEKPQRNDKMCLLESLKKTGVVDFHMRAVPGTEVPDHKVWWGRCIREVKQQKANSLHLNSCQIYAYKETGLFRVTVQVVKSTLRKYLVCRPGEGSCHSLPWLEIIIIRLSSLAMWNEELHWEYRCVTLNSLLRECVTDFYTPHNFWCLGWASTQDQGVHMHFILTQVRIKSLDMQN